MAKKVVAGVLLLAIAAWAEMALAPMLAMHAHAHPGRTLVAELSSRHAPNHHGVAAEQVAKHACCPPVVRIETEGMVELVAESSGCQDSHRCCFRQGPQSVPAPVSEDQQLRPQVASITVTSAALNVGVS